MLALTPAAVEVVNAITSGPGVPETAGLRIATAGEEQPGALAVELVPAPADTDQVVDTPARVYLEPEAAGYLSDKVLNGEVDESGQARFTLGQQSQDGALPQA